MIAFDPRIFDPAGFDTGGWSVVADLDGGVTSYDDPVEAGKVYEYRIAAITDDGVTAYTTVVLYAGGVVALALSLSDVDNFAIRLAEHSGSEWRLGTADARTYALAYETTDTTAMFLTEE